MDIHVYTFTMHTSSLIFMGIIFYGIMASTPIYWKSPIKSKPHECKFDHTKLSASTVWKDLVPVHVIVWSISTYSQVRLS